MATVCSAVLNILCRRCIRSCADLIWAYIYTLLIQRHVDWLALGGNSRVLSLDTCNWLEVDRLRNIARNFNLLLIFRW